MSNFSLASPGAASTHHALEQLAQFLQRHPDALLLTGAGISTASGIPDYRDADGVRRGNAPVQGPEFRRHDAVQRRYWARSMVGWPTLARAAPNPGHLAIARLAQRRQIGGLVTQNVDGLHQAAGSQTVIDLHGRLDQVRCMGCEARSSRELLQQRLLDANPGWDVLEAGIAPDGDADLEADFSAFSVPACEACGGVLKPDVVFFGENVPRERVAAVHEHLQRSDAVLVLGSSLMVYSGFRFVDAAAKAGLPIAAVNLGRTRADHLLSLKVEMPCAQALAFLLGGSKTQ